MNYETHELLEKSLHHVSCVPWHDETVSDYSSPQERCARDLETQESMGLVTSASGIATPYSHTLPKHFDVFREVISGISSLQNEHVIEITSQLLLALQRIFTINRSIIESSVDRQR